MGKNRRPSIERLFDRIIGCESGECWLVRGRTAYMRIKPNGRNVQAHRAVYELFRGRIPNGMVLDHLCRVKACVNPTHLEPVTNWENVRRGNSPIAIASRRRTCAVGHPSNAVNTRIDRHGKRHCRECERVRYRRRFEADPDAERARWKRTRQRHAEITKATARPGAGR